MFARLSNVTSSAASAHRRLLSDPSGAAPPLVISSYTLGTEVGYRDRVRAAAAAGFDGIGLRAENYWAAMEGGLTGADMVEIAGAAGTPVLEVEYLTAWGSAADRGPAQQHKELSVFEMARTFGVSHLNAGLLEKLPLEQMIDAFGTLCDRAGDDLMVALEFMPYSGVPDLSTAWQIIDGSGRANAGLIVDVWHWARAGMTAADLTTVPAARIISVQLCDVRAEPMSPLRSESLGHRLPPGEGHGDAAGLVRALDRHGVRPKVVAVEVISDELVAGGVESAATTCADAARRVLANASGQV